jgi:hypothetical protein
MSISGMVIGGVLIAAAIANVIYTYVRSHKGRRKRTLSDMKKNPYAPSAPPVNMNETNTFKQPLKFHGF